MNKEQWSVCHWLIYHHAAYFTTHHNNCPSAPYVSPPSIRDYCRSDALEALRRELVDTPQVMTVPCPSSSSHLSGLTSESSSSFASPAVALIPAEPSIATPHSASSFHTLSSSNSPSDLLVEWQQWELEQVQTTFAKVRQLSSQDLSLQKKLMIYICIALEPSHSITDVFIPSTLFDFA